jgi:hypothetical protein
MQLAFFFLDQNFVGQRKIAALGNWQEKGRQGQNNGQQ